MAMRAHEVLRLNASSTSARLLIVEDDRDIAEMLVELAQMNGYSAVSAGSGREMDRLLDKQPFDLILLDAMLPGEDGFSICRRLRAASDMPILMLTALGDDIDRVVGLELGADDYVTKPFNSRELVARIKALLRRSASTATPRPAANNAPLSFAGWTLDPAARSLVDPENVQISMTTAEFEILLAFCRNPNQVLTREQLLAMTHAGSAGPVERSVDAHISRVRQKIELHPKDPTFIKTVRLGGYMFTPKVTTH
ncbi:two-component system OmpR family response regulator [Rhizobium sp. PP-F2F-G38]|uniref:Regulatory protein VirG n=1 Tax=Ferranicluibacter rubi TaxID=2715133 RepID=A0AA43ZH08_9HYPH|nr:response regulator transcription factor [Ferranicluibacter rubi]PYE31692.1 two-component system OmpR family response regulator [Rhizobium sp. PP-WC-1G-195]PYE93660.1 two-component system OmpR family response regulator [Rhizobium sp. PP-F2F-G38]TCQ04327.1 two-component system OmpR family response regulator [Rhizobium sp. PP-F2F-G36]TCQ25794.1 two-component system OmpR family response regulator [Rhizobium sp. PP-CC-3G-465]NHT76931.1 response regulator transcription factor [Ferranicluibacter r